MASKLPTTETSSEGTVTVTDVGPETRDAVIAKTKQALQNYLGSNTTITVIPVSDDKYSQAPAPGQGPPPAGTHGTMTASITGNYVTPNIKDSSLAFYNTERFFVILFLSNENNSTNTRFIYEWHIQEAGGWKWYIGAPYLTEVTNFGHPVPISKEDITGQVAENTVEAIESSFENMMPGVPFRDVRFVWNRRSSQGDFDFQVSKTLLDQKKHVDHTYYWKAQEGKSSGVPLTDKQSHAGRFDFTQT